MKTYYFENGLSSEDEQAYPELFHVGFDPTNPVQPYSLKDDFLCFETFEIFSDIFYYFIDKLFQNYSEYHKKIIISPIFITECGLISDCSLSKENFIEFIELHSNRNDIFKIGYLYDCLFLIQSFSTQMLNVKNNFSQFYKKLYDIKFNLNTFTSKDSIYTISGYGVEDCYNSIYNIIIYLYSFFDIISKILFEYKYINVNFDKYPKLKSKNILFGDLKHVIGSNTKNTICENCETVNIVRCLRNEILHNAGWENVPRVFVEIRNKMVYDKFILLPDMNNGTIDKYINRKRFFSRDIKLNQILHIIVKDSVERIKKTIENTIKNIDTI